MSSLWFKTWYDECSKEFTYAYLISDLQTLNSYVWFYIIILFNYRFKWKRLSFFIYLSFFTWTLCHLNPNVWLLITEKKVGESLSRGRMTRRNGDSEKRLVSHWERKKKSEREFILSFLPLSLPFSCCLCVPCRNVLAFHFFLCVCPSGPSRQCLMPQQGHGKHRDTFMATSSLCENLVLPCLSFPYELLIK